MYILKFRISLVLRTQYIVHSIGYLRVIDIYILNMTNFNNLATLELNNCPNIILYRYTIYQPSLETCNECNCNVSSHARKYGLCER